MDRAPEFMTAEYIQHNPNVESGRDAFVRTIGSTRKARAVAPQILVPVSSHHEQSATSSR